MTRLAPSLLTLVALLIAGTVSAQPRPSAAPTVGAIASADTPATLRIEAGGTDRNPIPGSGCSGFITTGAPLATVEHGGGPLSIYVTSGTDTTLLVGDPAGHWQCSDDANDSNPAISYPSAPAGTYAVWVGTFSPEAAGADAQLHAVRGQPRW